MTVIKTNIKFMDEEVITIENFHSESKNDIKEIQDIDEELLLTDCAICLESIIVANNDKHTVQQNAQFIKTKCSHMFHYACWIQYYKSPSKSVCPICRTENCAPDDNRVPHRYIIDVDYSCELDNWNILINENFYFDYGKNRQLRNEMICERFISALQHIWLHQSGSLTVIVHAESTLLMEIYALHGYYERYINGIQLYMSVIDNYSTNSSDESHDDDNGDDENKHISTTIIDQQSVLVPKESCRLTLVLELRN